MTLSTGDHQPADIAQCSWQSFCGTSRELNHSTYLDDEEEAGKGEADEDSLVDVYCPVQKVTPEERHWEWQRANNI